MPVTDKLVETVVRLVDDKVNRPDNPRVSQLAQEIRQELIDVIDNVLVTAGHRPLHDGFKPRVEAAVNEALSTSINYTIRVALVKLGI